MTDLLTAPMTVGSQTFAAGQPVADLQRAIDRVMAEQADLPEACRGLAGKWREKAADVSWHPVRRDAWRDCASELEALASGGK